MKILRTNLDSEWAAHDLADDIVRERDLDLLMVGEPNKTIIKKTGWISDIRGDAAVCICNRNKGICSMMGRERYLIINFKPNF